MTLITLIVLFVAVVVTIVAVVAWACDQRDTIIANTEETKASLLLHQAHRERQLSEIDNRIRARTEGQLRQWEAGHWDKP